MLDELDAKHGQTVVTVAPNSGIYVGAGLDLVDRANRGAQAEHDLDLAQGVISDLRSQVQALTEENAKLKAVTPAPSAPAAPAQPAAPSAPAAPGAGQEGGTQQT